MKKYTILISLAAMCCTTLLYQNITPNLLDSAQQSDFCSDGQLAPAISWDSFPKLFFTAQELGKGVKCAQTALKMELLNNTAEMYANRTSRLTFYNNKINNIGINAERFYNSAVGDGNISSNPLNPREIITNVRNPGDARLVQRLATAAFYTPDSTTANNYRNLAKQILLKWADSTFTLNDMPQARIESAISSEHGLILGSNMVAFAAAYDLLAAGQAFTESAERTRVEDWFSRVMEIIALSNDAWMANCVLNTPFDYDGMSCERARGDNHVTVATAAIYVLATMTGNTLMKDRAIESDTPSKWGYKDRLGFIIYNLNDPVAKQDRFPTVHTGEIYDRWRGHYREKVRGLQLHRSFGYPFLNLGFLTVQALAAKRQGVNLLEPVQKVNSKSIYLEKAYLFYKLFLEKYNPGELMDSNNPKFNISSTPNYMSLPNSYCVNGDQPTSTDMGCIRHIEAGIVDSTQNDLAYTEAYYHTIFAGASALVKNRPTASQIAPVLTAAKMAYVNNAYSPHIIPFEPVLFLQRNR